LPVVCPVKERLCLLLKNLPFRHVGKSIFRILLA
jgi:hypothetical protein